MARAKSNSFIIDLPLKTTATDERELAIRLDAARQLENAVLGECLRRLDLMRESKAWQSARKMPKASVERRQAFKAVIEDFDFKSSMADRFAIACKNACWIADHMSSNEAQKAALRAFQSVAQYAFGVRGRPRFKRIGGVSSVEGKTNKAGVRWKSDAAAVEWSGLSIPAMISAHDTWLTEALKAETKYCRIVRREVRGKVRWFVQLIQEGISPRRHNTRPGVVGLDLGPSTIAAVSDRAAILEKFCPTIEQPWKKMRRLERAMDRSRRATNPDNFNVNGTVKKGRKLWNRSARYQRLAAERRERERRLAAERKIQHGQLVSRILAQGTTIRTEKLSYRAFQKCYGRSAKVRGCGMFVALLRRRAKEAEGAVIEFSTRTTRLSQFDHTTGVYTKKPLSQRIHILGDGSGTVQRDLYSAFLARFVGASERLDAREATKAFPDAKPLLGQAASGLLQSATGCGFPHPTALAQQAASERIACQEVKTPVEAVDDVTRGNPCEGRREMATAPAAGLFHKPPGFSHGVV
jgi:hypothetical protein